MFPKLTTQVESALFACGSGRVFHREDKVAVAIRWEPTQIPPRETWIVVEGATHNDAGAGAAKEFSARLRAEAKGLQEWADRIDRALAAKGGA